MFLAAFLIEMKINYKLGATIRKMMGGANVIDTYIRIYTKFSGALIDLSRMILSEAMSRREVCMNQTFDVLYPALLILPNFENRQHS